MKHPGNDDAHERARMMIALSGAEGSPAADSLSCDDLSCDDPACDDLSCDDRARAQQAWLAAHLESCLSCQEFAENSREAIRGLRGIPITAGARLVSATQMRVRRRAQELRRQQERFWVACLCCGAVTLSTVVTTAVAWLGFAWFGQQVQLSAPLWEGGLAVFYLTPAVFAGALLLARGTFLAEHDGPYRDLSGRD